MQLDAQLLDVGSADIQGCEIVEEGIVGRTCIGCCSCMKVPTTLLVAIRGTNETGIRRYRMAVWIRPEPHSCCFAGDFSCMLHR